MFLREKIGKEKTYIWIYNFVTLSTFKACLPLKSTTTVLLYIKLFIFALIICLKLSLETFIYSLPSPQSVLYRNENSLSLSPLGPLFRPERKAAKHDIGCLFALPPFFLQNRFTLLRLGASPLFPEWIFVFGNFQSIFGRHSETGTFLLFSKVSTSPLLLTSTSTAASLGVRYICIGHPPCISNFPPSKCRTSTWYFLGTTDDPRRTQYSYEFKSPHRKGMEWMRRKSSYYYDSDSYLCVHGSFTKMRALSKHCA